MSERPEIARAREAFLSWLESAGHRGRSFLEIHIRPASGGGWEIRHTADAGTPAVALHPLPTAADLLERARSTDRGRYRPLRTAPDLARGWLFQALSADALWEGMTALYPAMVLHWYRGSTAGAAAVPFAKTAARQSGIYSRVGELEGEALRSVIRSCCTEALCLRRPLWAPADTAVPSDLADPAAVPCPEACSIFVSLARESLATAGEAAALRGSPDRRAALASQLRMAAAALSEVVAAGDFHDPLNPRRLHLLAERIESGEPADGERAGDAGIEGGGIEIRWEEAGGTARVEAADRRAVLVAVATRTAIDFPSASDTPLPRITVTVGATGHDEEEPTVLFAFTGEPPPPHVADAIRTAFERYRSSAGVPARVAVSEG